MKKWAIITGAGTGIGEGLALNLASKGYQVLAVGRRREPLEKVKSKNPSQITTLSVDIATDEGVDLIDKAIPDGEELRFVVQNAAVGVPGRIGDIKRSDFEYAMAVNVTAPLMLTQKLLPKLQKSHGSRILHIGTNIAFGPQLGTATYGITKMAFHRLYEQLKVDLKGTGVSIGSAHPGVVDTEGLWDHAKLAKESGLPHAAYFDKLREDPGGMSSPEYVAKFLSFLLEDTTNEEFSLKEWHIKDDTLLPRWSKS